MSISWLIFLSSSFHSPVSLFNNKGTIHDGLSSASVQVRHCHNSQYRSLWSIPTLQQNLTYIYLNSRQATPGTTGTPSKILHEQRQLEVLIAQQKQLLDDITWKQPSALLSSPLETEKAKAYSLISDMDLAYMLTLL